jgi:phosphate/sulfate permease
MLSVGNSEEIEMDKVGVMGKIGAIISSMYIVPIIGAGVFLAAVLAHWVRRTVARDNAALDLSKSHVLQVQESPQSSALRLNAIWMRERSQA